MSVSELRLMKRCAEHKQRDQWKQIPSWVRGMYVLLKHRPRKKRGESDKFDVVYVGMSPSGGKGGIRIRLKRHNDRLKPGVWTHFSIFEVWDNIRTDEIAELEGLFRHIYSQDTRANKINKQRKFKKLTKITKNDLKKWKTPQTCC